MTAAAKRHRKVHPRQKQEPRGVTYKTYAFLDKNPMIDQVRTLIGNTPLAKVERETGVSVSCLRSWLNGTVLRPQEPTLRAVGRMFGMELQFVPAERSYLGRRKPFTTIEGGRR